LRQFCIQNIRNNTPGQLLLPFGNSSPRNDRQYSLYEGKAFIKKRNKCYLQAKNSKFWRFLS